MPAMHTSSETPVKAFGFKTFVKTPGLWTGGSKVSLLFFSQSTYDIMVMCMLLDRGALMSALGEAFSPSRLLLYLN